MIAVTPYDFPDLYSVIILGQRVSPGVVTLSGHDRNLDWDVQGAKGQTGATSKLNGDPIGQFQASFYLAAEGRDDIGEDDFTRWEEFQRLIESSTSGPTPVALPIYHPDLARNRFTEVCNGGISGLIWDDRGGATVVVKFIEYRPPKAKPAKKAASKPGQTTAGAASPPKPDPNAAAKRELSGLLDQARST